MNFTPELGIILVFLIWFLILTFFFVKFYFYYMRLVKNAKKESIVELLDNMIKRQEDNKKIIERLKQDYDKLEKQGQSHIQKVGLVRFNPFKDTGGDQSFILALVDAENTGVVISSLHTRTGTRWYAKGIVRGKGREYELSAEEEKALKGAQFLSEGIKG